MLKAQAFLIINGLEIILLGSIIDDQHIMTAGMSTN